MRKINVYAICPFDNILASRDNTVKFFSDHGDRLHQAVINGEPYDDLLVATDSKLAALKLSHSNTRITRTYLLARTKGVDAIMEEFETKILKYEANVLTFFDKDSPEYTEFFPHLRTEYSHLTKGNVETLFDQVITAFTNHKSELGPEFLEEFVKLKASYVAARAAQQQQKELKGTSIMSWEDALYEMADQAFDNLLSICKNNRRHPEKLANYFDQSIITPRKHTKADVEPKVYKLVVPAGTTRASDIVFDVGDTLLATNLGEDAVAWFGADNANAKATGNEPELLGGNDVEIKAETLGAPTNHYILFVNKSSKDINIEIILL